MPVVQFGVIVAEAVGVCEAVNVAVAVGVLLGVLVLDGVGLGPGELVSVLDGVWVGVTGGTPLIMRPRMLIVIWRTR
jgi:hypothetical protein